SHPFQGNLFPVVLTKFLADRAQHDAIFTKGFFCQGLSFFGAPFLQYLGVKDVDEFSNCATLILGDDAPDQFLGVLIVNLFGKMGVQVYERKTD
ncbi:hypothetical protein, partial [Acidithiobacillus sp.]|uniref:hypothetical protein n=1 Tax=Acidithiobacillus sp. TaxID=1872118 RepID=UPI00262584EF